MAGYTMKEGGLETYGAREEELRDWMKLVSSELYSW